MMNIQIWKKFLIDIYVYMNIHHSMDYIHTHGPYSHYTTSSYYDTLDLSDISMFEDLMTTPSNEDITALDEAGY